MDEMLKNGIKGEPESYDEKIAPDAYEYVYSPEHYNIYDVEVIEMVDRIWGPFIASKWCEINGFKYRMRMGTKPHEPVEKDIRKENVYLNKYEELKKKWKNHIDIATLTKEELDYIRELLLTGIKEYGVEEFFYMFFNINCVKGK